jgi:hypothetical protein
MLHGRIMSLSTKLLKIKKKVHEKTSNDLVESLKICLEVGYSVS